MARQHESAHPETTARPSPARPRFRAITALTAAAALTASTVLAGCGDSSGSSSGSSGGKIKIGLITKTETNPFFVKMREGAAKQAAAGGATLMTASGQYDGDNASQVTAIENMVAAGVKGILITPNDSKAIVPAIQRAKQRDVVVIALDTPTEPQNATDALFATNNFKAGQLIGTYAKAKMAGKPAKIATLDLAPGISVGVLRHNGFLQGYGVKAGDPSIVCSQDTQGDQAKGQTAMENCLQKAPDINVVYTINEPAALGAYNALKAKGREKDVLIVSVDGGCTGTRAVQSGQIAATSQQYPLKMAQDGVAAVVSYAKTKKKPSGYTDTGVTLITDKPLADVQAKDTKYGLANCWG
jgi:fructose transport system substrate-binding protein